ncbi:MAG: hypothetical protein ACM3SQ_03635 [Betaproteobacteria bacterium]
MATRRTLDREPGPVPEIRTSGDSVMYHMEVRDVGRDARLIIRCDPDGSVWASIDLPDEREW